MKKSSQTTQKPSSKRRARRAASTTYAAIAPALPSLGAQQAQMGLAAFEARQLPG